MIDNGTLQVIVDVREQVTEFCYEGAPTPPSGHIPGALNYPWNSGYFQAHYQDLPVNKRILIYCGVGGRSANASAFLCAHGYPSVFNMTGGLTAWTYATELCCESNAECNDELFCTGEETCENLECVHSGNPCGAYHRCNEDENICDYCPDDYDCDNASDSQDNCMTAPNGLWLGTCARVMNGIVIGNGMECFDNSTCPTGYYCQKDQQDCNSNLIGDACECYADGNNDGKVNTTDLGTLKTEFFRTNCGTVPCSADCNADNKVNTTDLGIMKSEFFRTGCPTP